MWREADALRSELLFQKVVIQTRYKDGTVETKRRPFALTSFPRDIQAVSAGAGLYFRTLVYFGLIMLIASLLAIYPIIDNVNASKTTRSYPLTVTNGDTAGEYTCAKNYPVRCTPSPLQVVAAAQLVRQSLLAPAADATLSRS